MNKVLWLIFCVIAIDAMAQRDFVYIDSTSQMRRGDAEYRINGANFWYGPILASDTEDGDMPRLKRELDALQRLGINNLRVLAGAEGPSGLPHHITPVLQTSAGVYDQRLLTGLDRFMAEVESRGMTVVIYLTNAWEWSGGYGSYLQWTGHGVAPVPGIDGYRQYVDHVREFVLSDSARALYRNHVCNMVSRTNAITGRPYSESPAILSWQIANEPRAFSSESKEELYKWLTETAQLIHQLDPNHMVSTGSEGKYGCESDLDLWERIHRHPSIDYAVIHLWPTNWGWASRDSVVEHLPRAIERSDMYITEHLKLSESMGKPLVIEEFGYPRDGFAFGVDASDSARRQYYRYVIGRCVAEKSVAGYNFWGWNGEARPESVVWVPGAPYCCDPAHEPQGMYGVFDTDSTVRVISRISACE